MEEGNVTVLVDAKEEYTKQLVSILKPCIYQGIQSIYMDAKDICHQDNNPDNVLIIFQDLLSRIPKWSQDIITKEFDRIASVSKCDYIDDLLRVVYVSHIKILTIVHSAQKNKKISIKVPSGSHFIHLCYIECARDFWKDPYLFSDRVTKYEKQKNMRDSETMISECISETIRKQLPIRNILKEFLNEPDEDIEEEEDIKEPVNKKYLKKLESVVKKELKTTPHSSEGFDIELIRKVIREEIDSRPSTNTIKKDIVDIVVEKIVEQSKEEVKDETEGKSTEESIVTSEIVEKDTTDSKDTKDVLEVIEKIEPVEPVEPVKPVVVKSILETVKSAVKNLITPKENIEVPDIKDIKETKETKIANGGGLESLLSDDIEVDNDTEIDATGIDTGMDTGIDTEINSNSNTEKDPQVDTKSKSNELFIDNINEVNLNLDELDNDNDNNEIDLDDLTTVDLKETKNELKNSENTKYIFFKDVK